MLVAHFCQAMAAEAGEAEVVVHNPIPLQLDGEYHQAAEEVDYVRQLREQKLALNQQKKLLTKQLKNEQRKKQRLRERAKKLSNDDLVRVLCEREAQAKAKAKPKAKPKARSGPS